MAIGELLRKGLVAVVLVVVVAWGSIWFWGEVRKIVDGPGRPDLEALVNGLAKDKRPAAMPVPFRADYPRPRAGR